MKKQPTQIIEAQPQVISPIQDEAQLLISQAIDKNVPVETMEKLLAMRRELKQEKAKEEYDKAMSQFQSECPTIEKRTQGYNYKYADLTSIIEQVKDLLATHGFSYTFDTDEVENAIIVYCKVKHISGHMEISKAQISRETTTKMNASQQSGAAMTYGKRYAFVNAFGILTGDEDTDARSVESKKPATVQPSVSQTTSSSDLLTHQQMKKIFATLNDKGKTKHDLDAWILKAFHKDSLSKLTKLEAEKVIEKLESLPALVADSRETDEQGDALDLDEVAEGIEQQQLEESK